jgi:hypothetical protein
MARPDGRIEPGQPLRGAISSRAWNRAQDAADLVLGSTTGIEAGGGRAGTTPYTWVLCRPTVTVARWGVLEITGVAITPTSTAGGATASYEEMPVLTGGTPSASTTSWCVAVEPIESGKVGRVAVSGVVQCKATVTNSSDKYVTCDSIGLKTDVKGEGLILWKGGGWALVRLGATAAVEQDVITGVTMGSSGLVFTKETLYVIGKKTPSPSSITISTTACT